MMKPSTVVLTFALSALAAAAAPAAHAGVCVQLDTAHDNLTEQERAGTMTMFVQALQQQGQQVATDNCQGTYVVYHVRLGYSINVVVNGPQGYRQATARTIEEVPPTYSQIIHSLLTGQPLGVMNNDRTNVTAGQQNLNRVEADSLWYARLGYGGVIGSNLASGPSFGFGYRYELDSLGIDFSFLNFVVPSSNSSNSSYGWSGSLIKLEALYFTNPVANGSFYFGGGAGYGFTVAARNDGTGSIQTDSGSGLQGELTAGYEFLRTSTIRMFAQADASLPFYKITSTFITPGGTSGSTDGRWAPTLGLSIGLGWGRSMARVHMVP